MVRFSLLAALAALAGCSCNQEYNFPQMLDIGGDDGAPENFGSWLSMDVAPDGKRITMTYYDKDQGGIGFAVGLPDGDKINWVHEHVDGYPGDDGLDRGDRGQYSSHKVAPDGTVWAAYKDLTNGGLYVAHRTAPGTWEVENADAGSGMGNWASLDVHADGTPVVAHHDSNTGTLRVCHRGVEAWTCETAHEGDSRSEPGDTGGVPVITPASVGEYARVVVEGDTEYIAFYDRAFGTLDLIEGKSGGYVHTVIDDAADVGQWPSILFSGETLYIAYHDVGDQDLMLATRDGGAWSRSTVDDGDYVGADTELFERNGELGILYFDGFNNDMKIAERSGGNWSMSTMAGDGIALGFHNEIVEVEGRWWAASYDYTNDLLYVAPLASANN